MTQQYKNYLFDINYDCKQKVVKIIMKYKNIVIKKHAIDMENIAYNENFCLHLLHLLQIMCDRRDKVTLMLRKNNFTILKNKSCYRKKINIFNVPCNVVVYLEHYTRNYSPMSINVTYNYFEIHYQFKKEICHRYNHLVYCRLHKLLNTDFNSIFSNYIETIILQEGL